ncbi:hypothetical protein E1B28_011598 [Marasmius oreades]|uniref:DUF6534 domain-containing protein n=1 Tax=Marasmius oreades TaxID=181124 RepID=A0A9P7UQ46_9AGAR|nr:uncharacterized protein E1B28_011598 [Marasmius oreades]KAG7089973.1 hypothetical protein E1B28_011598 [Marasmius oreades]
MDRPPATLTGPPMVALSLSCLLFGVLTVQIYLYHRKFPRDPISLQIFVAVVYLADTVQIVLLHIFCWDVFVTGLAIQGNSPTPTATAGAHTFIGCLIAAMVQGYFAWRIFSLRRDSVLVKVVAGMIILLALMQIASGVVGVGLYLGTGGAGATSVALLRKLVKFPQIWLIGAVVCDLLIAVAMTWILFSLGRDSSVRTTRSLIRSLILRSVETGTLTFIFTLFNLVLFLLYTDNYLYMVFDRTLSKLYSNALLLSLNARGDTDNTNIIITSMTDRERSRISIWNGSGLSPVQRGCRLTATPSSGPDEIHVTKHIETETHIERRAEVGGR